MLWSTGKHEYDGAFSTSPASNDCVGAVDNRSNRSGVRGVVSSAESNATSNSLRKRKGEGGRC